jgi:hypothetical protein
MHSVEAGHGISLDLAAEREHVASMGAEFDVMSIHKAFNCARLMRTLEVSGKLRAKLLDLHELCGTAGLVSILRVDRPISGSVVRPRLRLLLLGVLPGVRKICRRTELHIRLRQKILRFLRVTAQLIIISALRHIDSLVGIHDIALRRGKVPVPVRRERRACPPLMPRRVA